MGREKGMGTKRQVPTLFAVFSPSLQTSLCRRLKFGILLFMHRKPRPPTFIVNGLISLSSNNGGNADKHLLIRKRPQFIIVYHWNQNCFSFELPSSFNLNERFLIIFGALLLVLLSVAKSDIYF